jgi:hypothetical protein
MRTRPASHVARLGTRPGTVQLYDPMQIANGLQLRLRKRTLRGLLLRLSASATGVARENTILHGVGSGRSQTTLCLTRHVSCALEAATSQVRVRRIMARACIRTEARVNYVEKQRIWPGTAPFAK